MLDEQVEPPTNMVKAFIGTALGDYVERAYAKAHPDAMTQVNLQVSVTIAGREFLIPGHPDIVHGKRVLDVKTTAGLTMATNHGANNQQQWQRMLYGLGAWQAGLLGEIPIEDVEVGNIWLDRTGDEERVQVQVVPFDMAVVDEAIEWLESVVYAYTHNEVAMKEPARPVCYKMCGFAADCRGLDTDVTGLIDDEDIIHAVALHLDALDRAKQAEKDKREAKSIFKDITGNVFVKDSAYSIRSTFVNGGHVSFDRAGYNKIEIVKVKEGT